MMKQSKSKSIRDMAVELKGAANAIIWDWGLPVSEVEFKTLYNLVYYMDVLLTKCLDSKGRLINKIWIQKKLLSCVIILGTSRRKEILNIMKKTIDLENEVYLEDVYNDEDSDS